MTASGDRATITVYLATQTRPWRHEDALPNQGHLDTSLPAHAVNLDAIRRAAGIPIPPTVRHEYPRLPLERRRRSLWSIVADVAALTLAILAVVGAFALMRGLLGGL